MFLFFLFLLPFVSCEFLLLLFYLGLHSGSCLYFQSTSLCKKGSEVEHKEIRVCFEKGYLL